MKARFLAIALILLSIFLIYINWHELWIEGTYSMKIAAFAPLVGVGGLYLMFFPHAPESPTPPEKKSVR